MGLSTTQDTTHHSFEPCWFISKRKRILLSPTSRRSSSLPTFPSFSRQVFTTRSSNSPFQDWLALVRLSIFPAVSLLKRGAHSLWLLSLSPAGLPIDEASFLRDLHLDATRRTANFSRFLHLVLLASGCRYLVDAPSFLCRDGDQASRGLLFIDAAKTLVDQEGTSPELSSIAGFLLLSTFMVGMATE